MNLHEEKSLVPYDDHCHRGPAIAAVWVEPVAWRIGRHVPIHVYDAKTDVSIATFHSAEDAARAVAAVNAAPSSVLAENERLTRERDAFAKANARQASCIHQCAQATDPDASASIEGTPRRVKAVIAQLAAAEAALASMTAAVKTVLGFREGSLPGEGWLRDTPASRRALEALARTVQADRAVIAEGLLSDEDAEAAKLGRFGHHPDASCDFCIEVESLQGRFQNVIHGISKPGETVEHLLSVREGIARAMTFTVGGDPIAVSAKNDLRKLEALAVQADRAGEAG